MKTYDDYHGRTSPIALPAAASRLYRKVHVWSHFERDLPARILLDAIYTQAEIQLNAANPNRSTQLPRCYYEIQIQELPSGHPWA